ncbi:MAG: SDR family NAD(P)-dependent oxidoreductase [Psychromonas sp.]
MKTVLITGATSGIGKALCSLYQQLGWQVFACGRNQDSLNELQQLSGVTGLNFDICDKQKIQESTADLSELDLVILNAGSCEYIDDPMKFDSALFERVVRTNLIAVGYCLEVLIPKIKVGGQLALMSSSASYLPFPRAEAYGASKAAVSYLAKSLSVDLAPHNISVSLINPGFVKTPLTDKNNFAMAMLISAEQAATYIEKGLSRRKHEIHFPPLFTYLLKFFAWLPDTIWRYFAIRMLQK